MSDSDSKKSIVNGAGLPALVTELSEWGDIPDWCVDAINSLLSALKMVDESTHNHCIRVGHNSRLFAKFIGLNEYQQELAFYTGILHDVGKMGIDKNITHKPAKLTQPEYDEMKLHPEHSETLLLPLIHNDFFKNVRPAVRNHHERFDGTGYPDNLKADAIPLLARVILLSDTLDAMTENRAYRQGLPIEKVYDEVKKYAGTQFDPHLAEIFLKSHTQWFKESTENAAQDIAQRNSGQLLQFPKYKKTLKTG